MSLSCSHLLISPLVNSGSQTHDFPSKTGILKQQRTHTNTHEYTNNATKIHVLLCHIPVNLRSSPSQCHVTAAVAAAPFQSTDVPEIATAAAMVARLVLAMCHHCPTIPNPDLHGAQARDFGNVPSHVPLATVLVRQT